MSNVPNDSGISCLFTVISPIGPPTPTTPDQHAIADSGCTAHFCTITAHVVNKRPTKNPISIRNPNGTIMYSTHEADLDLLDLPLAARHVHIVRALSHFSLLSMGQLCDAGCRVTFDTCAVTVHHHERVILTGARDTATGLWHLSLLPSTVGDAAHSALHINAPTPATPSRTSVAPPPPFLPPPQVNSSRSPMQRSFRRRSPRYTAPSNVGSYPIFSPSHRVR